MTITENSIYIYHRSWKMWLANVLARVPFQTWRYFVYGQLWPVSAILGLLFPFFEGNCGFSPYLDRMNDAVFLEVFVMFGTIKPCPIHMEQLFPFTNEKVFHVTHWPIFSEFNALVPLFYSWSYSSFNKRTKSYLKMKL